MLIMHNYLWDIFWGRTRSLYRCRIFQKRSLEIANGGILFLDEIHRLPAEGQEMLFTFIDKGTFKRLGDATKERESKVLIICATTENPTSTLLDTFNRRIPMKIEIPSLRDRTMIERMELVKIFSRKNQKVFLFQ